MKNKYKVIIIGAGPSGLSCAINLYNLGIKDLLVVEKYKFPRYKCCAGYITNKTKKEYEKLGLNIEKTNYSLIKDFNIFYKNKPKQKINNQFLYTNRYIDRTELDNCFYELAKSKNIPILENTMIKNHNKDDNSILLTNKVEYKYDYLVFADGSVGFGSKYQNVKKKNIAMQLVCKTEKKESIEIHFGITKHGYAWVSSYNGITNIGLTDVYNKNVNYYDIFKNFLKSQNINADIKDLRGAYTPIGINKPIINENIFYIGDAAGLCDPFTLSGLRYGLKSGEVVAHSIKECNKKMYIKYIKKINKKFCFMILIQKIFYLRVVLFLVFNVGCKIFSKFISYAFNNFFVSKK